MSIIFTVDSDVKYVEIEEAPSVGFLFVDRVSGVGTVTVDYGGPALTNRLLFEGDAQAGSLDHLLYEDGSAFIYEGEY